MAFSAYGPRNVAQSEFGSPYDDAHLSGLHLRQLAESFKRTGIVNTGNLLAITYSSGLTWNINSGTVVKDGALFSHASDSVTLDAADGSNARWDLICYDTGADDIVKVTGTPSASNPFVPVPDQDDRIALFAVYVPAAAASFPSGGADAAADHVIDLRVIVPDRALLLNNGTVLGGVTSGNNLTYRSNTSDDGQHIITLRNPPGSSFDGAEWVTAAGRELYKMRYFDGGAGNEQDTSWWMFPPRDGGRVRLDFWLDPSYLTGGNEGALLQLHGHGRADGTHAAPGIQHLSFYLNKDQWGSVLTTLTGAGVDADDTVMAVADSSGFTVGEVYLLWDATSTPDVTAPDADHEYVLCTDRDNPGTSATFERHYWGTRAASHASGSKFYLVTRTNIKWLNICNGPDTDGYNVRLRALWETCDVDLGSNKLILNGSVSPISGRGNAYLAWDNSTREWQLTGPTDGFSFRTIRSTSTALLLTGEVAGDSVERFAVNAAGTIAIGPGSGAADIGLRRTPLDTGVGWELYAGSLALTGGNRILVNTLLQPPNSSDVVYFVNRSGQAATVLRASAFATSASGGGGFLMTHARDTEASPDLLISGDRMGFFVAAGYDGDAYHNVAAMEFLVDGTAADNQMPSRIIWATTPLASVTRAERMRLDNAGLLRVGPSTVTPAARLHVHEATIGNEVLRLESAATNDDPADIFRHSRLETTNATPTAFPQGVAIPDNTCVVIEAHIRARRSATAEVAGYIRRGTYRAASGTVTLVGAVQDGYTAEDVAGWDATLVISGSSVFAQATGVTSQTIRWHVTYRIMPVST